MKNRSKMERFPPNNPDLAYYAERIDRNIGWITEEEQEMLRRSVIGIAGCGGMGGRLAEIFLRLGVGEIRIADGEVFDVSNINRQFAASRGSVGRNKALETAERLREITDDTTVVVYPGGITRESAPEFVEACDVICDEVEFWCVAARILLHATARSSRVPVFVANTIGFGSHIYLFTEQSCTMEKCLGIAYEEAAVLEQKIREGNASEREIARTMFAVTRGLFPEWLEYSADSSPIQNKTFTRDRLIREGRGAIIATNPPFATGFLADRVLLYLLKNSHIARDVVELPLAPGYLYLDAAKMLARVVT
jgi:molybdopterin/thiamine biosynthesis adenylyltransferase